MSLHLASPAPPEHVLIGSGGAALVLRRGGQDVTLRATHLRAACRCAACAAARITGTLAAPAPDLRLASAVPIGGYALNLGFSDGHARGVFPFAYLAQLAAETTP